MLPETSPDTAVNPDTDFIREVLASSGGNLKRCYQCATCASVCALSTDGVPFPRQQMIATQWGLKDRLLNDPAIWLCHNCDDCTLRCPRDAKPGAVMAALREQAIGHYAWPRFMARFTSHSKYLPLLLAPPILIFAAIAKWAPREAPTPRLEFTNVFPDPVLEVVFWAVALFVILVYGVGIARMVKGLRQAGYHGRILGTLIPTAVEILSHKRFGLCTTEKRRRWGHLLTMFGFGGLFLVEVMVGIGYFTGTVQVPLPMTSPIKLFANLCTIALAAGLIAIGLERIGSREALAPNTYFDWFFLATLAGVVLTGIMCQFLRLAQSATYMYPVYFVHLVAVFCLFLYAPYSKFSHIVYRTVAMAATWDQRVQAEPRVVTTKEALAQSA
ncbi:MAG: quinone-interacting membrane-bound oxidoreductase complex subunit QmoC [Candidatus Binataceae bacterium]